MDKTTRQRINTDEDFIRMFQACIAEDDKLTAELIEAADFEANRHSAHDGCPNANNEDEICEDCYSYDTENEAQNRLADLMAKIWARTYDAWKEDRDPAQMHNSDDEGSDEAIEMEDSDDHREEQNEDGIYLKSSQ